MIIRGEQAEEKGLMQVAELMCVAARTAPKGRGVDNMETLLVTGCRDFWHYSQASWSPGMWLLWFRRL